jgi:YidC/Oxa1 family membrane protein insertase
VLNPLYTAISWVLLRWYWVFTHLGLGKSNGLTWGLSIVFLVVTARLLMFRLFIKQVHYQRRMQEVQPKLQAIRDKYKGDKAEQQRQIMAFQQAEGFNPLSGCLPLLIQWPVFIALFHVLRRLHENTRALYSWTQVETDSIVHAKLFGVPIIASFTKASDYASLGADVSSTRILLLILTAISALATHMTQRLAMSRAVTAPTGQAAMIQRLMLYLIPVFTFLSGFVFPLGVLIYWFTNNTWSMLQQFYINRVHPQTPIAPDPAARERARSLAPKPGARPSRAPRGTVIEGTVLDGDGIADSNDNGSVDLGKSAKAGGSSRATSNSGGSNSGGSNSGGSSNGSSGGSSSSTGGGGTAGGRGAPRPGARPTRSPNRPGTRPGGTSKAKKRR